MKFTYTPDALIQGVALTDAPAIYGTVPLDAKWMTDIFYLSHAHTTDITVSIWAIPLGDSAGVANLIFPSVVVPPNIPQPYTFGKYTLLPGTTIVAQASVTAVCHFSVSGAVVTE